MTLGQFQQQTNSQKKTFPYFICHNPLKNSHKETCLKIKTSQKHDSNSNNRTKIYPVFFFPHKNSENSII